VVVVVADTLRADRLTCYGYPGPSSPELDRLASDGVRFAQVIAQNTWTRPSHGSMLTSLYPRTLGLYDEPKEILADRFTTMAEVFQASGYTTIGATANPNINAYFHFDQGFDEYIDSDVVFDFMPCGASQRVRDETVTLPDASAVIRAALRAVDASRPPYYLQLNLMEVHEARLLTALDRYASLFPGEVQETRRRYVQAVRELSARVDQLVAELSSRPGFEDALFAIVSDHGEYLGDEHPHVADPKTHGFLVYESQSRVPWILYSPGRRLPRGLVVEQPVQLLDLMPTLLAYAGLDAPQGIEGRSLLPLLEHPESPSEGPEILVVETRFRGANKIAAYTRDWVLVRSLDGHPGELPTELQPHGQEDGATSDRSRDLPEETARLSDLLATWMKTHPEMPATYTAAGVPARLSRHLGELGYN